MSEQEGTTERPLAKWKKRHTVEELTAEYRAFSRSPFIAILAHLTHCIPSDDALQTFANDHPDRWANAVKTFSHLAGYHDKLEIPGNVHLQIHLLGDAQLLGKIQDVEKKLLELKPNEYEEVKKEDAEAPPILGAE